MSEDNRRKIQKYYDALQVGKPAGVVEAWTAICHPDAVLHEAASLPQGGRYEGMGRILEGMGRVAKYVADPRGVIVDHIVVDGDNVVVLLRIPWKAPGREDVVEMAVSEWYRFTDGLITEIRPFFWDTAVAAGRWSPDHPE